MDSDTKAQLLASAVQAIGVPLVRAGVNHRYTMKRIEREEEMAMKVAERRQRGVKAMAAETGSPRRTEPVALENPGDVYDELESLRHETDCGFCESVAGELMDAPPSEATDGLAELRAYQQEVERIQERDVDEQEAEQIVGDLVDSWSVVPRYAASQA